MIRISIILSFLAISCVVQAQETRPFMDRTVTYSFDERSISEVLKGLEAKYEGLFFVYSSSTFDMERKVSGDFRNVTLRAILEKVFEGESVELQEKKSKIIIRPNPESGGKGPSRSGQVKTRSEEKSESIDARAPARLRARRLSRSTQLDVKAKEGNASKTEPDTSTWQEKSKETIVAEEAQKQANVKFDVPLIQNHQHLEFPRKRINQPNTAYQIELPQDSTFLNSRVYQKALKQLKKDSARLARSQERLNEEKKFRAYVTSYTGYTQVGGKGGIQMGGSLVWLKNKRWGFGLSGYAVQRAVENDLVLSSDYRLAGGYGGVFIEYTRRPTDKFHLSFPLLIGGGGLGYARRNANMPSLPVRLVEDSKAFFVVESAVNAELNVTNFLRAGLSLGYRYTTNTNLNYQDGPAAITGNSALTGLNFGLTVKLGIF